MKRTPWGRSALILCCLVSGSAYAQVLTGLVVTGPAELNEGTGGVFTVRAFFSNGMNFEVTLFSQLSVTPPEFGTINQFGQFLAGQVDQDEVVFVNASFTWSGVTLQASSQVTIVDLSVYSCTAPAYQWGRGFGGLGTDGARRVCADGAGNVYVCGSFEQTVDFDPSGGVDQYTAAGGADGFVSKYSNTGQYLWTRVFSGQGTSVVTSVDVAPDGAVYLVGNFDVGIDLDPGPGVVAKTPVGLQDFFVVKLSGGGTFLWGHSLGGTNPDDANAVAVDHQGECIVVGSFQYTVDFDPGTAIVSRLASGQRDIFALKLAANGTFRWVYTAGNRQSDEGLAVAVDSDRNVFVAGRFSTIVDFDPGPAQAVLQVIGVTDCFIVRLSPDGVWQWVRGFGGPSTDGIRDVAVAANGDLVVGGYFWDTVDFDPGTGTDLLTSAGQSDGFVSCFTNTGQYRWTSRVGGPLMEEVASVTLDPEDRVLACGYFNGTVDFNDGAAVANVTSAGADDAFVIKYSSSSGAFQWVATFGGTQSDIANGISGDGSGLFLVAGSFRGTADFDPSAFNDPHLAVGLSDAFVSALRCGEAPYVDPFSCDSPAFLGALPVGGAGNDAACAVVVLADGSRFVAGSFTGTVDLNPGPGVDQRQAVGGSDAFVTRYGPDGTYSWSRTFGGPGYDYANALAVDRNGSVAIAGTFVQTVDFDPGAGVYNVASVGGTDAFVLRLSPAGDFMWVRTVGGTLDDAAYGVAIDSLGNASVAGAFQGTADFDPTAGVDSRLSKGSYDIFIWNLGPLGEYRWAYTVGRSNIDEAYAVAIGRNNRIIATGRFQSVVDFDPGPGTLPLTAAGATDVFVLALESNGAPYWVRGIGGPSTENGRAIACAANGDVTVAGHFWATCDLDPGEAVVAATSAGEGDVFVVRLSETGAFQWARVAGGAQNDEALGVTVDGSGNATVVGFFRVEANFDAGGSGYLLDALGGSDAFAWRLHADGGFGWAVALGGSGADDARAVDVAQTADVHVAGAFSGTAYLDPAGQAPVASAGGSDAYETMLRCGTGLPDLCPGDLNCDGTVSFTEIDLFVFALQGADGWSATFPNCPWLNADCNGDGVVAFEDIDGFVSLLGANCAAPLQPESPVGPTDRARPQPFLQ